MPVLTEKLPMATVSGWEAIFDPRSFRVVSRQTMLEGLGFEIASSSCGCTGNLARRAPRARWLAPCRDARVTAMGPGQHRDARRQFGPGVGPPAYATTRSPRAAYDPRATVEPLLQPATGARMGAGRGW